MSVDDIGSWAGTYAGKTKFGGKSNIPLCYVHFETQDGKMVLLAEEKKWDEEYSKIKLGTSVLVKFTRIKKDNNLVYVFEGLVCLPT